MTHEKGYNRGVSLFDDLGLQGRTTSANFNICLSTSSNGVSNSAWDGMQSGYSSTSPPGTVSSGSSTHSQYGRSPEDLSVDSLISSLLQVVNSDSFGSNCDVRISSNEGFGLSRCSRDCTDPLCDTCLGTRQNVNTTSGLLDHFGSLPSASLELPSPPMLRSGSTTSISPPSANHHIQHLHQQQQQQQQQLYCEIHREGQRLWCQTCSRTLCTECCGHLHRGHVTMNLIDAVEGAGAQANEVLNEARLGISSLREDLDTVQIAAENLEHKARQATADVLLCVRRVATVLETREKELLGRIEKARTMKFSSLKARDEGLRNGIARLSKTVDRLTEAMESSTIAGNPLDLLVTKDMASAEVFQIRQNRQNLPPPEENWISFTGPEGTVLHTIANLGSIMVNNPGPIGDRRAVRGRGSSPLALTQQQQNGQSTQHVPLPRGRPVPSNSFPVTVRTGRTGSFSSTVKPSKIIGNDGDARDNLCRPWGVACDKEGHIIVADRSNNRIQIYREDGSFVRRFGTHGTGPGQFDRPAGVAVDARRRIVVADKDNHRVQILTMEGLFLLTFGEKGCRCGQFNYPWDVAVNSESQIVVSDTRNHRIQLFSPEGIFLRKYGYETTPSMWKHFDSPRGVAFNPEGNVVTTDFNNHRVIVIDSDFLNAKVLGCETNGGTKQFLRPQGLVIDDEGNIIIADSRNHRIQVFDSTGALKWKFGSYGKGQDEMDRPSGIALSPSGKIAVVDFGNNRVLMI